MAVTGTPLAGYGGSCVLNNTTLYFEEWSVEEHAENIRTTNFGSSGLHERIAGPRECHVMAKGFWDDGINPHVNPPNLNAGQFLTNSSLGVDSNDGWTFARLFVERSRTVCNVNGRVDFEVDCWSDGPYTRPS